MAEFFASEFFVMGGHAGFIWPAYGAGLIILGGFWYTSLRALRAREREIAELEKAAPHRQRANEEETA
jgi:heme exporter protein D